MKEVSKIRHRDFAQSGMATLKALAVLMKFRLTSLVVFSSVMGALIVGGVGGLAPTDFILLIVGGFLVSGSAGAANQWIEKDADAKMRRTQNRPLVKGEIELPLALLVIGLSVITGLLLLALLNLQVAIIGGISWFLYVLIYTPMKRYTPFAVFIGAIPGALPVLAGTVAVQEEITLVAFLIFSLQFIWQFPHFWAIAWVADDDYKRAGFQLLPNPTGLKDESTGWQSFVYAVLLSPVSLVLWYNGFIHWSGCILLLVINLLYAKYSWDLYREQSDQSAKNLMFASFAYLPLALSICWGSQIF